MKTIVKILHIIGIIFIILLGLSLIIYACIYFKTEKRLNKYYSVKETHLEILRDSQAIVNGEHLYKIKGCIDCHGAKLEGSVFMDDPLLMKITAPNLTQGVGGLATNYSGNDWFRAIRHGIDKKGRSLILMPSHELYHLTNKDLNDIIAYCTTQLPVDTQLKPMRSIGPLGRLLMSIGEVTFLPAEKIDHTFIPEDEMTLEINTYFGKYLSVGCQGCHRPNMQGGGPLAPGFPSVPNITSEGELGNWNLDDFKETIKTGKTPSGKLLNNQFMPWQSMQHYTDAELESIFLYLKSLK